MCQKRNKTFAMVNGGTREIHVTCAIQIHNIKKKKFGTLARNVPQWAMIPPQIGTFFRFWDVFQHLRDVVELYRDIFLGRSLCFLGRRISLFGIYFLGQWVHIVLFDLLYVTVHAKRWHQSVKIFFSLALDYEKTVPWEPS